MQDFRKLAVWRRAHALTLAVYKLTLDFPEDERFGLRSQLRRASASIPTNIAESCGTETPKAQARFLSIALSSAFEVDYLMQLSTGLGYLGDQSIGEEVREIKRMLSGLKRRVLATPKLKTEN